MTTEAPGWPTSGLSSRNLVCHGGDRRFVRLMQNFVRVGPGQVLGTSQPKSGAARVLLLCEREGKHHRRFLRQNCMCRLSNSRSYEREKGRGGSEKRSEQGISQCYPCRHFTTASVLDHLLLLRALGHAHVPGHGHRQGLHSHQRATEKESLLQLHACERWSRRWNFPVHAHGHRSLLVALKYLISVLFRMATEHIDRALMLWTHS